MTKFWSKANWSALAKIDQCTPSIAQGDYLPTCLVPIYTPDFGRHDTLWEVPVERVDLILMTQTCDLAQARTEHVALCPITALGRFQEANPKFRDKRRLEELRKGRVEGLHLLASPVEPEDNRQSLVVDFKRIISLPFHYVVAHSEELGERWRLDSPFLEHFSQAFARFFMRVGLPASIPPFK